MWRAMTRMCFYLRDKAGPADVSDGVGALTPLLTIMAAALHHADNSPWNKVLDEDSWTGSRIPSNQSQDDSGKCKPLGSSGVVLCIWHFATSALLILYSNWTHQVVCNDRWKWKNLHNTVFFLTAASALCGLSENVTDYTGTFTWEWIPQSLWPKTSMSSQFLLFHQSEKRRLAPGERCFNSAFCADYCMKGEEHNTRETVNVGLFDPLSQKQWN